MQAVLALVALVACAFAAPPPPESERALAWYKANNTWPPNWHEESDGYKRLMDKREVQIMKILGANERWENFMQLTQSYMVPKFSKTGFKVMPIPREVYDNLHKRAMDGLRNIDALPVEPRPQVLQYHTGRDTKIIDISSTGGWISTSGWDAVAKLKGMHEEFAGGIKLKQSGAHGIRVHQNGATVVMHYDKINNEVISSLMHIAHSYDDEIDPWPIQIEDHNGNLHSINLEAGQMLIYEGAKCLHGRMTSLKGKYYASILVHYQPVDTALWSFTRDDVVKNVPPRWRMGTIEEASPRWAGAAITVDDRVVAGAPDRHRDFEVAHASPRDPRFPPLTPPPTAEEVRAAHIEHASLPTDVGHAQKFEPAMFHREL